MGHGSHFRPARSSLTDSAIEQERRIAAELNTSVQLVVEPLSTPREHDPPLSDNGKRELCENGRLRTFIHKKKHAEKKQRREGGTT